MDPDPYFECPIGIRIQIYNTFSPTSYVDQLQFFFSQQKSLENFSSEFYYEKKMGIQLLCYFQDNFLESMAIWSDKVKLTQSRFKLSVVNYW